MNKRDVPLSRKHIPCEYRQHVLQSRTTFGDHRIEVVSRRSGIPKWRLYELTGGRRSMYAEEIPLIYRATNNDIELFDALSGASDAGLVVSRQASADMRGSSGIQAACRAIRQAGSFAAMAADAAQDGHISASEATPLRQEIRELRRELANADTVLAEIEKLRPTRVGGE